jgi:hypothetical protein
VPGTLLPDTFDDVLARIVRVHVEDRAAAVAGQESILTAVVR